MVSSSENAPGEWGSYFGTSPRHTSTNTPPAALCEVQEAHDLDYQGRRGGGLLLLRGGGALPRRQQRMTPIICVMCEAITDNWVVWGAAYVEEVYYFCSNDCLAGWLVRLKREIPLC